MALDLGKLIRNVLSAGTTYFRDQRQAKEEEAEARDLIAQNTDMFQQMLDRGVGESEWRGVQSDPAMRAAQLRALADLEGVGDRYGLARQDFERMSREGFSDLDRQALDQAFRQSRREEQAQRGAALDAAARRGDVSGGNALLGALMAGQGGADRAADFATTVGLASRDRAYDARLRALEALEGLGRYAQQAGGFASGLRGQDFGEQAQRAGALDSFTQWATGQQLNTAQALANARLGQAQSQQQYAQQLASTPNAEAAANAVMAYYTGGASGALGGGQQQAAPAPGYASGRVQGGSQQYTPTPWVQGSPSSADEYARRRAQGGT